MTESTRTPQERGAEAGHDIPFSEALKVWVRVAALSFGGPAGQIAVMHRILVEEKRWIGERRFLHALNFCMLLPGPEAQQLTVYIGWLLHRVKGGLSAGTLFVLPGFVSILALSYIYVAFGDVDAIEGFFLGLKAAVLAIVLQAVSRIGGRALRNPPMLGIAAASFVAIFFFGVPFPLIILAAALIGFLATRMGSVLFQTGGPHATDGEAASDSSTIGNHVPEHARPGLAWSARISAIFLLLWLAPVGVLVVAAGPGDTFTQIAVFFSQMAVVTFGGAYAVLAYVAQQAVQSYGWLEPREMLDGLGMAETTPGPLIQVVQFVAFMGAYRDPGPFDPWVAATLAAVLATWVTFVPCFLWIFLGAPYMERLRENRALTGAMSAITAAVVGVIANLAIWFGIHVMFDELVARGGYGVEVDVPVWSSFNAPATVLMLAAIPLVFALRAPIFVVLLSCSLAGVAWVLVAGPP